MIFFFFFLALKFLIIVKRCPILQYIWFVQITFFSNPPEIPSFSNLCHNIIIHLLSALFPRVHRLIDKCAIFLLLMALLEEYFVLHVEQSLLVLIRGRGYLPSRLAKSVHDIP